MNNYILKDLIKIHNGTKYSHLKKGNIPLYGSGGVMSFVNDFLYEGEAVLLPRKGTLTNIMYVNSKIWTVDTMYYATTNEKVEPYYLYSYLSILDLKHLDSGSSLPSMTKSAYDNIEVKLPNIDIQKQIAKVLSDLDAKIEVNNKINQELEAMAKTLYDYWFVQFDFPDENGKPYKSSGGKMVCNEVLKREIPEGWNSNTLADWIANDKSGDWGKDSEQGNYINKVSCIRGADLNGLNGKGEVKAPTRFVLEKNSHKLLEVGDLIIEISGGSPVQSTGRMAFMTEETLERFENPLICSNFCKAVTLKEDYSLYNFVYLWQRLYDAGVLFGWEGKTSGIKNLLFESFVSNYKVPNPPKEIIKLFYEKAKPIHSQIQKNLQQNQKLAELRDWLLPMLMNGQVTIGSTIEKQDLGEVEEELGMVAEPEAVYEKDNSLKMVVVKPVAKEAAIIGTHIVSQLAESNGMGRTKFQKVLHLSEYFCEKEFGGLYTRNTAGPHNDILIRVIEGKMRNYNHISIKSEFQDGKKRFIYKTTSRTVESETLYKALSEPFKTKLDTLIDVLKPLNLKQTEAISTLYAVWNNRLIEGLEINTQILKQDFYNWSDRKRKEFCDTDIAQAMDVMKLQGIVPNGWGSYIGKGK